MLPLTVLTELHPRGGVWDFSEIKTKASLISVLVAVIFIKSPCVMLNVSLGVADPQSNSI